MDDSYADDFDEDIEQVQEEEIVEAVETANSLSPRYDDSFLSASDTPKAAELTPRRRNRRMALQAGQRLGSLSPLSQMPLAAQPADAMGQPAHGSQYSAFFDAAPAATTAAAAAAHPTLTIPDSSAAEPARIGEPSPAAFLPSDSPGSSREGEHNAAPSDSPGSFRGGNEPFPSPSPAQADLSQFGADDPFEPAHAAAGSADRSVTPVAATGIGAAGFFPTRSAPAAPARLDTAEGEEDDDAGAAAAYSSPVFSASAGPVLGVSSFNMTPPPAAGGMGHYSAAFFSDPVPDASPADISNFGRDDLDDDVQQHGRGRRGVEGRDDRPGGDVSPRDRSEGFDAFEDAAARRGIVLSQLSGPHAQAQGTPASPRLRAVGTPDLAGASSYGAGVAGHEQPQATPPFTAADADADAEAQNEHPPSADAGMAPQTSSYAFGGVGDGGVGGGDLVEEEFGEWDESPAAPEPAAAFEPADNEPRPSSSEARAAAAAFEHASAPATQERPHSPVAAVAEERKDPEAPRSPLVSVHDAALDESLDLERRTARSPARSVGHEDSPDPALHAHAATHSAVDWGAQAIISSTTDEAVVHPHEQHAPLPSAVEQPAVAPASPIKQRSASPSQAASPRSNAHAAPAAAPAALPLPPVAPASPSPMDRLLAHQAARAEAQARHQAELESARVLQAQRARDAEAAAEVVRAHRRPLLSRMPDSHYAPAPVAACEANLPRVLQSAPLTVAWQPAHAPAAVSAHAASKAVDWSRCAAPSAAALPSERYDRAAAAFAQFLRTGSSARTSAAPARTGAAAAHFGAVESYERTQAATDPTRPYNELQAHGLSDRARAMVKRAAGASAAITAAGIGDPLARSGLVPARQRSGAFEMPLALAASRLSNPALASILSYTSAAAAGRAPGLSARARAIATGQAPGGGAYASQAAAGTGLARLAERRAEESQRVMLLRLAWREREDEQAALAASMAAASADAQARENHDSSVLAVHDALRRREAAERRRLLRGDPSWSAPDTAGADAGFYSAFERERAARAQFERLRSRGVDITPRLERHVLARGADCEADEDASSDAGSVRAPTHRLGDDDDASEDGEADLSVRSQQYDENGDSLPPTPRVTTMPMTTDAHQRALQPRSVLQQQPQPAWSPYSTVGGAGGEAEEKYPYPPIAKPHDQVAAAVVPRLDGARMEWEQLAHEDQTEDSHTISPGRVFTRTGSGMASAADAFAY